MKVPYVIEYARTGVSQKFLRFSGLAERRRRVADARFSEIVASLKPGDLAIDLGANVGTFTRRMAETGADVIAFEPDPYTLTRLRENIAEFPNVTVLGLAAASEAGYLELFRLAYFEADPDRNTEGSTIVSGSRLPTGSASVRVEAIDFAAFLETTGRQVRLLKIDIEGAEVALMERLLESGAAQMVQYAFVETHERLFISLAARTRALKRRTSNIQRPVVNWDWR